MSDEAKKPNVKALVAYRLKGAPVHVGDVVAKSDFPNANDWRNLCHMSPPRVEETADKVGPAETKGKKTAASMPGA